MGIRIWVGTYHFLGFLRMFPAFPRVYPKRYPGTEGENIQNRAITNPAKNTLRQPNALPVGLAPSANSIYLTSLNPSFYDRQACHSYLLPPVHAHCLFPNA